MLHRVVLLLIPRLLAVTVMRRAVAWAPFVAVRYTPTGALSAGPMTLQSVRPNVELTGTLRQAA